jgi:transposase
MPAKCTSASWTGTATSSERSAVIYTLLGSCRRHGINPFDYLKDLFTRLPAAKITQIKEFTPAVWAATTAKQNPVDRAA